MIMMSLSIFQGLVCAFGERQKRPLYAQESPVAIGFLVTLENGRAAPGTVMGTTPPLHTPQTPTTRHKDTINQS